MYCPIEGEIKLGDSYREKEEFDPNSDKPPLEVIKIYAGEELDKRAQLMLIVAFSKEELKVGDLCLFYNSISIIDEIFNQDQPYENWSVKLRSLSQISEDDKSFFKIKDDRKFGIMNHGFSAKQLRKIVGTPHPEKLNAIFNTQISFTEQSYK